MDEPGRLHDLSELGRAAWEDAIRSCAESALGATLEHPFLRLRLERGSSALTSPDWTGLPTRVVACLGRRRALAVLDDQRRLQEEYLEWRVVRDRDGRLQRVELTTELSDYWRVLAAHEPQRAVEVAAELVGRAVRPDDLYGGPPPDSPEERRRAFVVTVIEHPSALNDGREGILFMTHADNDLRALFKLAAVAAHPCVLTDEVTRRRRCANSDEVIPLLERGAVAGRASDPVLVERLGRLAFERRLVAFDDPVGIYIHGIEHTRLRTPGGDPVPVDWFRFGRGASAEQASDGQTRHQRLIFEVPPKHGLRVGDLVDAATERRIAYGGQVAELVQLRLLLHASDAGTVDSDAALAFAPDRRPADPCAEVFSVVGDADGAR
jgi:hypothetical protein